MQRKMLAGAQAGWESAVSVEYRQFIHPVTGASLRTPADTPVLWAKCAWNYSMVEGAWLLFRTLFSRFREAL